MSADLDYDFGAVDGIMFVVGLPLVATLVFVLLSPVSFFIYKMLSAKGAAMASADSMENQGPGE